MSETLTAAVIMSIFVVEAGFLAQRLVHLIRKDYRDFQRPQFDRALYLILVVLGVWAGAMLMNAAIAGDLPPLGWLDYLVVVLVVVNPVLAAACVVLVNRHLDGR